MSGDIVEAIKRELTANRMELKTLLGSEAMEIEPETPIPAPFLSVEDQYVQVIGSLHSGIISELPQALHAANVYTESLFEYWKTTNNRMSRFKTPPKPFVEYSDAEFNTALTQLKHSATDMGPVKSILFPGMAGGQVYHSRPTADQKNNSKPTVIQIAIGIYQTNEINRRIAAFSLSRN
jgi:hypothetical protein